MESDQQVGTRCANCTLPCERLNTGNEEGKAQILSHLHLSMTHHATDKQDDIENPPVTIAEAMNVIFGIKFCSRATDAPDVTMEKCLILCSRCDKHLSKLYHLFCQFEELCHEDSYISTHIQDAQLGSNSDSKTDKRTLSNQKYEKREPEMITQKGGQKLNEGYSSQFNGTSATNRVAPMKTKKDAYLDDSSDSDSSSDSYQNIVIKEEYIEPEESETELVVGEVYSLNIPKKRGRPRKQEVEDPVSGIQLDNADVPKRKRGRPRKPKLEGPECVKESPYLFGEKRGRPRKHPYPLEVSELVQDSPDPFSPKPKRGRPRKDEAVLLEPEHIQDQDNSSIQKPKLGRPRKSISNSLNLNNSELFRREEDDAPDFDSFEVQQNDGELPKDDRTPSNGILNRTRGLPRKSYVDDATESDSETEQADDKTSENGETHNRKLGRPKKYFSAHERPKKIRKLGRFTCEVCGKVANTKHNLKVHVQKVHEGYRPFQCPICKQNYQNKGYLDIHIQAKHSGEPNLYVCPEPDCGKSFKYPAGLYVHKPVHTGELKFTCNICHKKFPRICYLKSHLSTHGTERPFICEHCGSAFKTRGNLENHKVIHDERGRFKGNPAPKCTICNKTFLRHENLRIHMQTVHEKIKPFKCPICNKAFSHCNNLKVHLAGFHRCPKDSNNKIILPATATVTSNYSIFSKESQPEIPQDININEFEEFITPPDTDTHPNPELPSTSDADEYNYPVNPVPESILFSNQSIVQAQDQGSLNSNNYLSYSYI